MFVTFLRFAADRSRAPQFMAAHNAWVDQGLAEGAFLCVGSLQPGLGGAILAEGEDRAAHDARIAGPLAALLGMVHGAYDGDALFFSRDLVIEGDTAAVLALRNAIDAAELDLAAEIEALAGPARGMVERIVALAEKRTGVALTRHEEADAW